MIVSGTEFGSSDRGSVMRIDKDLYGLKSSGSDWRENISETLNSIVYQYTELDPVVWFKLDVNSSGD